MSPKPAPLTDGARVSAFFAGGTFLTTLIAAVIGAVMGATGLAFVGVVCSQYFPVFGGFIELNLAQAWSPARMNLIPIHVFVFGLVGLFLGGIGGLLLGLLLGLTKGRSSKSGSRHSGELSK